MLDFGSGPFDEQFQGMDAYNGESEADDEQQGFSSFAAAVEEKRQGGGGGQQDNERAQPGDG